MLFLGRLGFPVQNTQESGNLKVFGFQESVLTNDNDDEPSVDNYP